MRFDEVWFPVDLCAIAPKSPVSSQVSCLSPHALPGSSTHLAGQVAIHTGLGQITCPCKS